MLLLLPAPAAGAPDVTAAATYKGEGRASPAHSAARKGAGRAWPKRKEHSSAGAHVHTHLDIHIHVSIHLHIHIHIHMRTCARTHTRKAWHGTARHGTERTHACTHAHTHARTHTRTYVHTCICATQTLARISTCVRTYTCTRAYDDSDMLMSRPCARQECPCHLRLPRTRTIKNACKTSRTTHDL